MIKSFINYTGGKYKLLKQILPNLSDNFGVFVDVFCGSGVVGINAVISSDSYYRLEMHDNNKQLVELINWIKDNDIKNILHQIDAIINKYGLSNTSQLGYAYYNTNSKIGLADVNRTAYLKLRDDYNNNPTPLLLYVLIVYGFNNQLRFNNKNKYNIPVGKRDFNKNMRDKLQKYSFAVKNDNVAISLCDFRDVPIDNNKFYYLDPPYLIGNASYNAYWNEKDECDLIEYIDKLDKAGAQFALSNVLELKNKKNNVLNDWLKKRNYHIYHLSFNYDNSNYHSKNNGITDEVLITNY